MLMKTSRLQFFNFMRSAMTAIFFAVCGIAIGQTSSPLSLNAGDASALYDTYHYEFQDPIHFKALTDPVNGAINGIENIWDGNFIAFNNIDFGSYTANVTMRKPVNRGAKVELWIDTTIDEEGKTFSGGRMIGSYVWAYSDNNNSSRWETVNIPIAPTGGEHNLIAVFYKDGGSAALRNLGGLASIKLDRTIGATSATAITATNASETLAVSDEVALSYELTPLNTDVNALVWVVTDGQEYINLSQDGTVTGLKAGDATVTLYSTTNASVFASFNITVVGDFVSQQERFEFGNADILKDTYHWGGNENTIVATTLTDAAASETMSGIKLSWNTNYAVFNNVDFGAKGSKITVRRQAPRGGKVQFWADAIPSADEKTLTGGIFLGETVYNYAGGRDNNRAWETREIAIPTAISGTHTVYALFFFAGGSNYEQDLGGWGWFEVTQETPNLQSIIPSEKNVSLVVDAEETITLTFAPLKTNDKDVTWTIEAGNDIISVADGKITALKAGNPQVKVSSVSNPSISAIINVTVSPATSIDNDELSATKAYIHKDVLHIDTALAVDNIIVSDISGRIIYSSGISSTTIDASVWANGVYFVLINTDSGDVTTKVLKK